MRADAHDVESIVVVGGGQAGFSFVERARKHFPDARIHLICEERIFPYQRPPLSKKYINGEMSLDSLMFRDKKWYDDNRIELHLGASVRVIERTTQTIKLSNSDTFGYDRLLFATGSIPLRLPSQMGGRLNNVFEMRTVVDADDLAPVLNEDIGLLIVGGGYIGLEAAAIASRAGVRVTLVEMADRILQRVASEKTADYFRNLHRENGVTILEGVRLENLVADDTDTVCEAILSTGDRLAINAALIGIGVEPNVKLAQLSGLDVNNGVCVNAFCQTSDPLIYAAGDCTSFSYKGQKIRLESVQNAIEQAQCAADHMSGSGNEYAPIPWFWSDQYDTKLQIAGLNTGYTKTVIRKGQRDGSQSIWYFKGEEFIAVDAMNDAKSYLTGKKLLEMGRGLTQKQAADSDFDLKAHLKA